MYDEAEYEDTLKSWVVPTYKLCALINFTFDLPVTPMTSFLINAFSRLRDPHFLCIASKFIPYIYIHFTNSLDFRQKLDHGG